MAGINDNLIPATKGEVRNPYGKSGKDGTKGKHLKTLIQEIGNNIDWSKTTLKNKDQLKQMYGNNGFKALVYVAMTKALAGDPQAMKFIAENGFGKHLDITSNGKDVQAIPMVVDFGGINVKSDTETE